MEKELILISEGMHRTGIEMEENDLHGNWAAFHQSYPHPMMGHSTEKVMVKVEDFDKVIEFLQAMKQEYTNI